MRNTLCRGPSDGAAGRPAGLGPVAPASRARAGRRDRALIPSCGLDDGSGGRDEAGRALDRHTRAGAACRRHCWHPVFDPADGQFSAPAAVGPGRSAGGRRMASDPFEHRGAGVESGAVRRHRLPVVHRHAARPPGGTGRPLLCHRLSRQRARIRPSVANAIVLSGSSKYAGASPNSASIRAESTPRSCRMYSDAWQELEWSFCGRDADHPAKAGT